MPTSCCQGGTKAPDNSGESGPVFSAGYVNLVNQVDRGLFFSPVILFRVAVLTLLCLYWPAAGAQLWHEAQTSCFEGGIF